MRLVQWLFVVGAMLFVFGIGFVVIGARAARQTPPPAQAAPIVPIASIKQIMNGIIDPGATKVFDSVSTTVSDRGVEEVVPRNDEEWAAVGTSAAALAEAGNMLLIDGRAIDRGDWVTMAIAMIEAAKQTLAAVDAKSPDKILEAGSNLNTSCDNCHRRYQRQ